MANRLSTYAFSVSDSFVYPLLFLAATPFFMNRLGEQTFGTWMLVNTVLITLQVFNFGIGNSTLRYVSAYRASSDTYKMHSVVAVNLRLGGLLLLTCCICTWILAALVAYSDLFHIDATSQTVTAAAMAVAGGVAGMKFIEQVFLNAYKAFGRFDLVFYANSGNRLLTLAVNLAQARMGTDLLQLFTGNMIISLLFLLIEWWMFQRLSPEFTLRHRAHHDVKKQVSSFGFLNWVQSAWMVLAFQADKFVVASVFGTALFGYYSILATIISQLQLAVSAVAQVYIPSFIRDHQRQERVALQTVFYNARRLIYLLHIGGLMLFYFAGPWIFRFWFGDAKADHLLDLFGYFVILAAAGYLNILPYAFLNACGKEKQATVSTVLLGVLCITAVITGGYVYHSVAAILVISSVVIGFSNILLEFYTSYVLYGYRQWPQVLLMIVGAGMLVCLVCVQTVSLQIICVAGLLLILTVNMLFYKKPLTH